MKRSFDNPWQKGSPRLQGYDYSADGVYFITICTYKRQRFFGKIIKGRMNLSPAGKIVAEEWGKTPMIRANMNLTLDEWCIMPDHFHALLVIGNPILPEINPHLPPIDSPPAEFVSPSKNLGAIMKGFKGACKRRIRQTEIVNFDWQERYYDHIIRDQESLQRIRKYITDNPKNWKGGE
ncbi:MAG: transposase [Bacteroidetes bacterium]|nr:transposase [Bacteroidota bacterium]